MATEAPFLLKIKIKMDFDKVFSIDKLRKPCCCLHPHTTHTSHIMSLDFHPKKMHLFDSVIETMNRNSNFQICGFYQSTISFSGGSAQVRFPPMSVQLPAAPSDKLFSSLMLKPIEQFISSNYLIQV